VGPTVQQNREKDDGGQTTILRSLRIHVAGTGNAVESTSSKKRKQEKAKRMKEETVWWHFPEVNLRRTQRVCRETPMLVRFL